MTHQSTNPYAPPLADNATNDASRRYIELLPLWTWLFVVVLTSILGTPADPISMLIPLIFGLISFWVGAILGSKVHLIVRLLPLIPWIAVAAWFARGGFDLFTIIVQCLGVISIVMGAWSSRRIRRGRFRIIGSFSVGYVLGTIAGPLGTAVGAVTATVLARRSVHAPGLQTRKMNSVVDRS
jgi:hypothetical protein